MKTKSNSLKKLTEKEKMLKGLPYDASDKELRKFFFLCKDAGCG